ncbi:hypothetical protein GCM10007977_034720 [Dactylosporangium sucinum]|uniref:DUF742 domain-containing protein n=2 Tax=Dactylosporangium sucinum TaxID=1424081 RepID=A0A917TNG1_9ACTN|nr:hypothetical protein GCM10007977_034720 [Dactylosporangium sucinum]
MPHDLADEVWTDVDAGPLVRLYALTRGRVAPATEGLDVAALVTTSPAPAASETGVSPEQREILRLCVRPVSVAEVAAHLGVPLGAARVLLADLREHGLVRAGHVRAGHVSAGLAGAGLAGAGLAGAGLAGAGLAGADSDAADEPSEQLLGKVLSGLLDL